MSQPPSDRPGVGDPYGGSPGEPYGGSPPPPSYGESGQPPPYGESGQLPSYGESGQPPSYGEWAPPGQAPYQGVGTPPYPGGPGQAAPPWAGQAAPPWAGQQVWQAPQYGGQVPPWQSTFDRSGDPLAYAVPAGAGPRLGARILDGLILGVPFAVLGVALGMFSEPAVDAAGNVALWTPAAVLLQLFELATRLTYQAAFIALKGATPGKMACGVRVIDERTGQRLSFWRALGREVVLMLSGLLCLIGYFSLFFDSLGLKRGWHDRAVGSRVIRG